MRLHAAADDRTGALEVAAALADRGAGGADGVAVAVWPNSVDDDVFVVDLGSRHLAPADAARRAASLPVVGPAAHKIDSTLRGNWAHELVARHQASGAPVLLIPALPRLGRVCVGGVVLADGEPVHLGAAAYDARRPVASSHPAEHLAEAGARDVVGISSPADLRRWLAAPHGMAVVDASTDAEIDAAVAEWSVADHVLLAGTSSVIAAAVAGQCDDSARHRTTAPVLVVCGSLHAVARRQIDVALEAGAVRVDDAHSAVAALRSGRHAVLASPLPVGAVTPADADVAAASLADAAREVMTSFPDLGTVVVIGGDTAAALLGTSTVRVAGSVLPGTAWVDVPSIAPPVVTRAGGFGDERALSDLLWGTLRP